MTIDVALLRQLAARPNTSLVAGPVVLLKPTTVTELLDAYEERDRLLDEIERAAQLAVEAKNTILKLRGALDLAQTANRHYASLVRGAALEGRE